MTLWNPLNVFSGQASSSDEGPSASFDPSRTGDPLGPLPGNPGIGIGVGDAQVGVTSGSGDPRRHPIGFAPPEIETPSRFRTEISFRRHHEAPRASAVPADDIAGSAWQSPRVETGSVTIDESPADETSLPFFRREISFRRKKSVDDSLVAAEDVNQVAEEPAEEAEAEIVEQDLPVEPEAVASESLESDEPVVDDEETAAEPVAASVPFYKRELSLRRKKADVEETPVTVAGAALSAEETPDDATEVVSQADDSVPAWVVESHEPPTDERATVEEASVEEASIEEAYVEPVAEIATAPELEAGVMTENEDVVEVDDWPGAEPALEAPVATAVVTTEATQPASEDARDSETGAEIEAVEPAERQPVDESVDQPPVAPAEDTVADVIPLPAAGADADAGALADGDLPSDAAETPAAEAAAPSGRFGSRKQKAAATKAAKRQRSGGAKGRKIVGLKIGASQIAAAVVAETDAGHELVGLARRTLAAGIVVDGEVRDEGALANAVKALFDEEKLPRTDVHLGLSSNRIGVRTLDIDGVDEESRFDNAVRFKAHEVLPVALSESVLDYRVLDERVGEEGERTRRVLLVVAPRDQVEPYQRVAAQAGIKVTAIDLEALALLRAFVEPGSGVPAPDDTATVVIAIGHESSTLLVSGGGVCEFTRVFDWGGGALEDAIATSLEVRPAEAATILRHLSLTGPGRQYELLNEETRRTATDAIRQRLTPFARELVNSLQFYQTQAESLGIGRILVTGGTSHLEGLDDALHQMIGVEVSIGDPFARVIRAADFDPVLEASIGSLAVPIGLAIEDISTRGVNLLPKGSQSKKSASRSTLLSIGVPVAAVIPLAALSFLYLGAHSKVVDSKGQLAAVQAQIDALPVPKPAPVIESGVVGDEAVRATAVAQVLGGRLAWDAVFRDMARVLPANVWLSSLALTQPEAQNPADAATGAAAALPGQGASTPTAVVMDGFTYTQPDVARLLARLATLPSLARVTLQSSQSQDIGTKPVVHFTIVADLSQTGGAS